MKRTEKKEPIKTVPKGVWEATHDNTPKKETQSIGEDLQKNGYSKKSRKD